MTFAYKSLLLSQFIKFSWVGIAATALQYLVLVTLVFFVDVRPAVASAIGYGLGACLSYFLNYHFTFVSRRAHCGTLARFFAVAGIGLMLNAAILIFTNEMLGFNYLFAQVIATALVLGWNFIANRLWTFGASSA